MYFSGLSASLGIGTPLEHRGARAPGLFPLPGLPLLSLRVSPALEADGETGSVDLSPREPSSLLPWGTTKPLRSEVLRSNVDEAVPKRRLASRVFELAGQPPVESSLPVKREGAARA